MYSTGLYLRPDTGWDVEDIARFSSAVSAIKCTRVGQGRNTRPATVEQFLKDGTIDYREIDQRVAFYRDHMFNLQGESMVETSGGPYII